MHEDNRINKLEDAQIKNSRRRLMSYLHKCCFKVNKLFAEVADVSML